MKRINYSSKVIHFIICSKKKSDGPGKDSLMKDAIATAKLWESRFHATDRSRREYWYSGNILIVTICYYFYNSANVKRLVGENEVLQDNITKVSCLHYVWAGH